MAEPGAVAREDHEHVEHGSHVARYAIVWGALLFFTLLTWGLSRLHIPGGWGVLVALTIAVTKATLVALFFMHLWDQRGANRLVFVTSLVFVMLLIGLTLSDNATRFKLANPPGSEGAMPLAPSDYPGGPPTPPRGRGISN
jgi:cytochrome c oxidase subunit IV